jgi:hypothetical protein
MLAEIRPPTLKQLPNVIGLGVPPINGTTTPSDPMSVVKPSVDHHFLEAWNLKSAGFKEESRPLPGQHNPRIQHKRRVVRSKAGSSSEGEERELKFPLRRHQHPIQHTTD